MTGAVRQPDLALFPHSGPLYGFNRPDAKVSQPVIDNWVRQAMTGGALAEHDEITVPVLVMQGEDDQVVNPDRAPMAVGLLKNGTLKTYPGYPHGMPVTHVRKASAVLLRVPI